MRKTNIRHRGSMSVKRPRATCERSIKIIVGEVPKREPEQTLPHLGSAPIRIEV
jgi:hypothetical protein